MKSLALTTLMAATTLSALASTEPNPKDFFPIMAWNNMRHAPAGDRLEQLKTMKECGFNIAGFMTLEELALAEKAGLQAIVLDDRAHAYKWRDGVNATTARAKLSSLVAEVKNRPSVYGYYVCDEPTYHDLKGIGVVTNILKELDPARWAYVNMLPGSASADEITTDYSKFLDDFIARCSPSILSVDDYSLMSLLEKKDPAYIDRFFQTMKEMRARALEHNLPFNNIILSMPHRYFAEPTRGNIARQVYSSLAYGAKGLTYFCYFTNDSEGARLGPIDIHGDKTPTWDIIRAVNKEVHALAPTLNRLTSQRVYFLGKVPQGADAPPKDAWVVNTKKDDPNENPNILVGEFLHEDGTRYVMLVNLDADHTVVLHHQFPGTKEIYHVTAGDGSLRPHAPKFLYLAPGMGVLHKLVDSK